MVIRKVGELVKHNGIDKKEQNKKNKKVLV